ncbi:9-cis-epoxycarotenoid dioxygenase 1 [Rhynchospora pubera]|uniref:9-cis-epoxycarotenoid dioxygenase 1 n=1 Tax=Rhynchospora pubera TaxID=906938 RepID=A0AAV8CJW6_9POAL|nr:9-cis-epoxycarotenoid dioxygenase 1 [Rhynchospora pubera]
MEALTTSSYHSINPSNRKLRSKRSPLISVSAVLTREKPAAAPSPRPSKYPTQTAPEKVPAPEKTNDASSRTSAATRPKARPRPTMPPAAPLSLPMAFCNALEGVINTFVDPPALRPSVDPRNVLSDNFAPVDELPPTRCPVIRGSIPPCLVGGTYIRNGPNPQHLPRGPHHLFDGDGMLHSLLFSADGDATLCSRYVQTYRYLTERDAGTAVMPNVFGAFHGIAGMARGAVTAARVLTGQMNPIQGVGLANTSLVFFAGGLYALGESDLPYAVHVDPVTGEISTIGRQDFSGRLMMGMTAHPKKDSVTGETFAFRYGPVPPFLTYFRFDPAGNKLADVPIFSVQQPSFMHDFAITENYAVFGDIQVVMKPMDMVFGNRAPVGSDQGKVPRLGVLPRYATNESEIRWFDVPGFNMMHSVNAWEEESANGEKYLVLVGPNVLSIEHMLDDLNLVHSNVEMVRINLNTGVVSRKPLSAANLDFPVIHPGYVGRKNRYAYLASMANPMPKVSGVVKLDFSRIDTGNCVVASRDFGPRCYGGEPFFVPNDGSEEEDDGYLVSYVHNEETDESTFVVMDARSPTLEIVAEVLLPDRVPYGFHGLFVSKAELLSQRPFS